MLTNYHLLVDHF